MKINLKVRMILSNILISILLVFTLYFVSNYFFQKQFQKYVMVQQAVKNKEIVQVITNAYGESGEVPNITFFEDFGNDLLKQHMILTVYNEKNEQIFCMACSQKESCNHTINSMKDMMKSMYPNLKGEYIEDKYEIIKNDQSLGYVNLGYFGPFFYNESDRKFVQTFNDIFVLITVLSLFGSVGLGIFSASKISKPIMKIKEKTKQISAGDYSGKIIVSKSDTVEIQELATSVNSLARNLNEQLVLKKRMAGDFTHEFLTPLTTLQGTIEAMIDGIFEVSPERLQNLKLEVERLSRMVYDIDKLVETNNRSEYKKEKINLGEIVDQVLTTFETELHRKKINLIYQKKDFYLVASKDKISQVVINLISNAIKYTNICGTIEIKLEQTTENTIFVIRDTGIGISEEDIPYIFEYLYKADKSRTRAMGGSGIGLYVVKNIVDDHNGTIDVKSILNVGTTFTVILPNNKY